MGKTAITLHRVLRGDADANVRFEDLRALLKTLGFAERVRGDHHIFSLAGVAEILNLQPRGALAKPYQVKQVRGVLTANPWAYDAKGLAAPPSEQPGEARTPPDAEDSDGP